MKRPEVYEGSASYPRPSPGPVVTIGNFDGVHAGHRALIDRAIRIARERGVPSCAYTFHPSPVEVLRPDHPSPRIQSLDERIASLGDAGIDQVVVEAFDRGFAAHDAAWFADEVLLRRLGATAVVVGWDFRFGHGRAGTADVLRDLLPVPVEQVQPVELDGEIVSSSRVRKRVLAGDVEGAAALLGRPHRVTGRVVHGDGRGTGLGFPTANVAPETQLVPGHGVYAVVVHTGGAVLPGVANLGLRPTFDGKRPALEVHVLDWSGDLYGRTIGIDFVARLRGEQRFASVDELVAQIGSDVAAARQALG